MKMAFRKLLLLFFVAQAGASLFAGNLRDRSFDTDWLFCRGDAPGAENPLFDESQWRKLDLPHDWSIEDLPANEKSIRIGPFDSGESEGGNKTGYVVGGVGWYRKHFTLDETNKLVAVRFDGVYMNADTWINGHLLGDHPYGYSSFEFDLTPYLKPFGQENLLAVRVRNEGKNSRWYSGSVTAESKLTARFDVPYAPGELCAFGLINGQVVAKATLKTSGAPAKLKLTADRTDIRADRNDLSYITVEVVDANGQRVPNAEVPVRFSVSGAGELAAQGSGIPNDPASFQAPVRKTFQGRCLAILRPKGAGGSITLRAETDGLKPENITIQAR